jgi:hypothetical protein
MRLGVLGPKSNAHGPNEFLHIQMGKRVCNLSVEYGLRGKICHFLFVSILFVC